MSRASSRASTRASWLVNLDVSVFDESKTAGLIDELKRAKQVGFVFVSAGMLDPDLLALFSSRLPSGKYS